MSRTGWLCWFALLLFTSCFSGWLVIDYYESHNPAALIGISLTTWCALNGLVGPFIYRDKNP